MTIDHYDEVVALWNSCEGLGEAEPHDEIDRFLRRNAGFSLIARDGKTLVAAALCGHDGKRGYLYHVAVSPTHRRQGIGEQIVRVCLDRLGAIGIVRCSIHLYIDNDDGEQFWLSTGWRRRTDLKVMAQDLKVEGRNTQ